MNDKANPAYALRLTFAYRDTQITLMGSERVAMIVPATSDAPPEAGQTGYWFTVRDAAGNVVYHRPLHDPAKADVEAFSSDPGQPIVRVPLARSEGRFTVLMPDIPEAQSFELHGPADPRRPGEQGARQCPKSSNSDRGLSEAVPMLNGGPNPSAKAPSCAGCSRRPCCWSASGHRSRSSIGRSARSRAP